MAKKIDWHRADVVAALKKQGMTVAALGRANGLASRTLYAALKTDYPKGERIIAHALGLQPEDIWPNRIAQRNFKADLLQVVNV